MWLMLGLAVGILGIIVLTGEPEPASATVAAAPAPVVTPSANRVRDYQDRMRILGERAAQQQLLSESAPEPVIWST